MKYIFTIFVILFLFSCNKERENKEAKNIDVKNIPIDSSSVTNEIDNSDKEVTYNFLDVEEIKKIISENIFYGINTDPNYYINNNKYTVEYDFDKEDSERGIAQDTNYMWAYNDYITISFANNVLMGVHIIKKTDMHFLGKYIGENINEIDGVFGNVYKWQLNRSQSYSIKNNDVYYAVQVIRMNSDSDIIHSIDIGITGILSSGKLPKIEKE